LLRDQELRRRRGGRALASALRGDGSAGGDWLREAITVRVAGELLVVGDVEIALDAAFPGCWCCPEQDRTSRAGRRQASWSLQVAGAPRWQTRDLGIRLDWRAFGRSSWRWMKGDLRPARFAAHFVQTDCGQIRLSFLPNSRLWLIPASWRYPTVQSIRTSSISRRTSIVRLPIRLLQI
jgi:hypothetical protein